MSTKMNATGLSGSATSAAASTAATAATAAAATSCGCVARARIARVVPECRIQAAEGVHSCQGTHPQEQELGQQGLMAGRRKLFPQTVLMLKRKKQKWISR